MRFTLKEVLAVVLFACSLTAAWFDLRAQVQTVRTEVQVMNGQVQWLLAEAIKSGWSPPPPGWVMRDYSDEPR